MSIETFIRGWMSLLAMAVATIIGLSASSVIALGAYKFIAWILR